MDQLSILISPYYNTTDVKLISCNTSYVHLNTIQHNNVGLILTRSRMAHLSVPLFAGSHPRRRFVHKIDGPDPLLRSRPYTARPCVVA